MSITSRILWTLAGLLFLAVVVVAWLEVGPMLHPSATLVASLDDTCDLRKGYCEAAFPDGARVTFGITPRRIPVVEKLQLSVQTEGVDARRVEVDFSGVDMNMGFNRVTLARTGAGEFSGPAMLPVCVRARMTWEAKVLMHTDTGLMAAPFRFDTYLPGQEPSGAAKEAGLE